ncbi:MAG TPA: AMP-binding protein [Solirubrobacteraceae bacterium]|jgi:acyl-CoA synthetase (AMP-forming)/AMP-acid ligase II|nr:AMP-binding protein [Solirubrobacteraceae bacterium]
MAIRDGRSHWIPDPAEAPPLRDLTVAALLDESAGRWPDAEAIVYSAYDDLGIRERWTFQELRQRARAVARAFIADGFDAGERVGVWATNRPEWLLTQLGAAYAGVVLVPMNPLYRSFEVEDVLGRAGASGCFAEPEDRGSDLWAILERVSANLPQLRRRVAFGEPAGVGFGDWLSGGDGVAEAALQRRTARVRPQDTSQIQFTSGTTGFPKGAELRNAGIVNNARMFAQRAQFHEGGRHCNPMPYFHCGGCVMSTLGAIATGSAQLPTLTFDAARVARTVDMESATSLSAVPTMLIGVEEAITRSGGSLESLEVIVTGGSPVPVDVERRWMEQFGVRFTITYGLTEASPVITQSDPDDPVELQIATCGRPLPHVEVDIVDAAHEPVPVGEQGELRTRGTMVMKGYWGDAGATSRTIDPGGWLRSGDLARMDAEGYVSITGRAKEMIIRGGENISPAEIEDALRRLPGVIDASVVGVPDERYGEQVAAFVRIREGVDRNAEAMRRQLAGQVARYKIPRYLLFVSEFPVTPSGKVQKFKLREQFVAAMSQEARHVR